MTIDNGSFDLGIPKIDHGLALDWNTIANAGAYASDALLGTNFVGNKYNYEIANQNLDWQKEYAAKMEGFLRESWQREDNAVQRRVADLKSAGLSPTLAAGSAAATSQPIQLKAPQNDFQYQNPFAGGILDTLAKVVSIKSGELQNELLKKNIEHYGEPAWFKALQAILDKFGKDGGGSLITNIVNGVDKALDSSGVDHGPVEYTPEFGITYAQPSKGVSTSSSEVISAANNNDAIVTVDGDGKYNVTFESAKDERQFFLDLGGTTYEWYIGIRKYGSPEAYLQHVIETGNTK